jgi:hypothetical protein
LAVAQKQSLQTGSLFRLIPEAEPTSLKASSLQILWSESILQNGAEQTTVIDAISLSRFGRLSFDKSSTKTTFKVLQDTCVKLFFLRSHSLQ